MRKENGMLRPTDKKENAREDGKLFVCTDCNAKRRILGYKFGFTVLCEKCPGRMEEYIKE